MRRALHLGVLILAAITGVGGLAPLAAEELAMQPTDLLRAPVEDSAETIAQLSHWGLTAADLHLHNRFAVLDRAGYESRKGEIQHAAETGDAAAQWLTALAIASRATSPDDHSPAAAWATKAAEQGFAPGQELIGWLTAEGRGVRLDLLAATEWWLAAALQGDVRAQTNLTERSYAPSGRVWELTQQVRLSLLDKAVARNFPPALRRRGKAAEAAALGDPEAYSALAINELSASSDATAGIELLRKAAEGGDVRSYSRLGDLYRDGRLTSSSKAKVGKNKALAETYYARFVERATPLAQAGNIALKKKLYFAYALGEGVPKDRVRAQYWLDSAAEQGDLDARIDRADGFINAVGADLNCPRGLAEMEQLVREGSVEAKQRYGMRLIQEMCGTRQRMRGWALMDEAVAQANEAERYGTQSALNLMSQRYSREEKSGGGLLDTLLAATPLIANAFIETANEQARQQALEEQRRQIRNAQLAEARQRLRAQQDRMTAASIASRNALNNRAAAPPQPTAAPRPTPSREAPAVVNGSMAASPSLVASAPKPVASRPAPAPEIIAMSEGVVVCPLDQDRARLFGESMCYGPFQNALSNVEKASDIATACGLNGGGAPRDLGTYGNYRVWGCGYGINPRRSGSPNIDQAQRFNLIIPARRTYRCSVTINGYCRN